MEWRDEAIVLGVRRHGESSVIAEVLTKTHGRHMGLVRGGRSKRLQPVLQPGNGVDVVWRARIEEQLGTFVLEATEMRAAALMQSPQALHGISLIGALLRLLPERDANPAMYELVGLLVQHLTDLKIGPALMVRFEVAILTELGFGLDLSECAATGTRDDLIYVSPKSGRAVCRAAGEPYKARMLPLPAFLRPGHLHPGSGNPDTTPAEILDGFSLSEYFLLRDVFQPRGLALPDARRAYLATAKVLGATP